MLAASACGSSSRGDTAGTGGSSGSGGDAGCTSFDTLCNGECLRRAGDSASGCTLVTTEYAQDLALADGFLYAAGNESVYRIELASLTSETLVDDLVNPEEVLLDGDTLYYTTTNGSQPTGTLSKLPKAGGAPTVLASELVHPVNLTLVDSTFYFSSGQPHRGSVTLMRVPSAGGTPEQLPVGEEVIAFALDATTVFYPHVVGSEFSASVRASPLAELDQQTQVADLGSSAEMLIADGAELYFSGFTPGAEGGGDLDTVWGRFPKAGGTPETFGTNPEPAVFRLRDGDDFYFIELTADGARLLVASVAGADFTPLATFESGSDALYGWPIVLDATYLYVGTTDGVVRIAR